MTRMVAAICSAALTISTAGMAAGAEPVVKHPNLLLNSAEIEQVKARVTVPGGHCAWHSGNDTRLSEGFAERWPPPASRRWSRD